MALFSPNLAEVMPIIWARWFSLDTVKCTESPTKVPFWQSDKDNNVTSQRKTNQPLLDELTEQQRNAVMVGADAIKVAR